ncbi:5'/3'-nucleotidase SurE [Brackiella oedipodis]|uniref:5'/3'-nucleotidase SurE n=1 Tax=Brackiella oedipodis TaxID=124225 RepID=UPI0004914967|nr:5'/3'-nucleotidase SurE [Brackiella oedipodis]
MKKKILLTNDDGYNAKGLELLAKALEPIADVTVFAPETNHSGASNSLTLVRPLMIRQAANGFYYANGTPTDCVHLALTGFLQEPPDLLVSGINNGANLGEDTLYSGTVAAASEGYLFGVPSIAFSLVKRGWEHIQPAVRAAVHIIQKQLEQPRQNPMLLSVNIPSIAEHSYKKIRVTRLGRRHPSQKVIPIQSPNGETMYWIGAVGQIKDKAFETDFAAIEDNCISITPLHLDLTNHAEIALTKDWLNSA